MKKKYIVLLFLFFHQSFCFLGPIKKAVSRIQTWSGSVILPSRVFFPSTIGEIESIFALARENNTSVRFFGSGHSINDLVATKGFLVFTDNFNKILSVNKDKKQVRVQGGIKLKNLYKELAKYDLALSNQGFIKEQSIAGALATGTHGTGKTGPMSDFIVSIELIDSTGNYRIIDDTHPELLQAARLHLGTLGFIYAVTLQCVPLFVLSHQRKMHTWSEVFAHFDQFYNNNDYFMLMAHPVSDHVLVYTWNKTDKKPTNNQFIRLQEQFFMNKTMNYLTIKSSYAAPGLTNDLIDLFFKGMEQPEHREYSYITLSPINDPYQVKDYIEEEIAIPVQHLKTAVADIFDLYKRYKKYGFELVGFITIRFVKGSTKALLSPAYDQDSVYISLITINKYPRVKEFYKEFEQLVTKYKFARPHWGKFNTLNQEKVKELWQDNLKKFNDVRKKFDPYNLFTNNYVQERLG